MKERVLITGASGFIGFHLIEAALREGMEVYAAVRPSSDVSHLAPLDIKYIMPDFNNADSIRKELEKERFTYIIHAAGTTREKTQEAYNRINATYTQNLALAAASADIPLKKFVFLSSLAAIGPIAYTDVKPIDELSEARPVTSYGRSKLLAEQYLQDIQLPLITIRPTAVYGPREKDIFIMFKTLKGGLEPYIGRQPQTLTFVYATDVAQAVIKALQCDMVNKTYNLSDGKQYSRYELADLIKSVLGRRTLKMHVPMGIVRLIASSLERAYARSSKAPVINREKLFELSAENWNCSIENIKKDLGFMPEYDLAKGVTQTIKWYQANNWL